jgi:hypothetical protein
VWILLAWIQEPVFLRRSGAPFFWDSVEAALSVVFLLLPLVWLLARSPAASESVLRAAARPFRVIAISALSIIGYGMSLAFLASLFAWSLDLLRGAQSAGMALGCALRGLGLLAPLASLAPGLAFSSLSAQGSTVSWLVIAVSYAALIGPGPTGILTWSEIAAPALLSTAAGLLLSTAIIRHRIKV